MLQVVDLSRPAETVGVQVLKSRGLFPQKYWYWIGVGALLGHILVFNGLFALALSYLERKCLILYLICNMSVLPYIYIYISSCIDDHKISAALGRGQTQAIVSEDKLEDGVDKTDNTASSVKSDSGMVLHTLRPERSTCSSLLYFSLILF